MRTLRYRTCLKARVAKPEGCIGRKRDLLRERIRKVFHALHFQLGWLDVLHHTLDLVSEVLDYAPQTDDAGQI